MCDQLLPTEEPDAREVTQLIKAAGWRHSDPTRPRNDAGCTHGKRIWAGGGGLAIKAAFDPGYGHQSPLLLT
jgi:hypothetical protein